MIGKGILWCHQTWMEHGLFLEKYPLVNIQKAAENGHRNCCFIKNGGSFHMWQFTRG
jgi:hypothetical protein